MGQNDSLPIRPDAAPDGAWDGVAGLVLQRGRPYGAGPPSFLLRLVNVSRARLVEPHHQRRFAARAAGTITVSAASARGAR